MSTETLLELWEGLGATERKVFLTYGWRLRAGQRKYGLLEDNKKEWDMEAIEEALDASVYLGTLLVQRMDALRFSDREPELK